MWVQGCLAHQQALELEERVEDDRPCSPATQPTRALDAALRLGARDLASSTTSIIVHGYRVKAVRFILDSPRNRFSSEHPVGAYGLT